MDNDPKVIKSSDSTSSDDLSSSILDTPSTPVEGSNSQTDASVTNPIMSSQAGPKRKTKMLVIVAVVLLVVIGGALAYASISSSDKGSSIKTPAKPAASTETQATTKDVDETTKDVDENLNTVNDEEDFNSTDLSDSSLDM